MAKTNTIKTINELQSVKSENPVSSSAPDGVAHAVSEFTHNSEEGYLHYPHNIEDTRKFLTPSESPDRRRRK